MTDNHGSAKIFNHCSHRLNFLNRLRRSRGGFDAFPIGQNRLPQEWPGWGKYESCHYGALWSPARSRGHALCIGANRKGKGAGIIIPAALIYAGNMVFLDFKGELAWITAERRRKLGHRTVIIDPVGVVNRDYGSKVGVTETVTRYNPLYGLDPTGRTFADDVASIVSALIRDEGSESGANAYWSRAARDLVVGIVAAEVIGRGSKASFRHVRVALNLDDAAFSDYCRQVCGMYPGSLAAAKLRQFVEMTAKSNVEVKSTARFQTGFLDSGALLDSMETDANPFSFDELGKPGLTVYICCPASDAEQYSGWLRLLIQNAMRSLMRNRPALNLPVMFMLDEMPVLGSMPVITQAYGVASGLGIVIWGFVQDLPQLQHMFPRNWETCWGNSACIQLLAGQNNATTQYISNFLGNRTISTEQISESEGRSQGEGLKGNNSRSKGKNKSMGETGRPLLFPHEIEGMASDRMLAIYPGGNRYMLRKFQYYNDPRFRGLFRPDPFYPAPNGLRGRMAYWSEKVKDGFRILDAAL